MRKPYRRHRGARGAAAVEFALVMPILFLVMFGIIQYGLYFNDSLNTRQGVREGARLGRGRQLRQRPRLHQRPTDMAKLRVQRPGLRIDALTGDAYVKVVGPASWSQGTAAGRLRAGEVRGRGRPAARCPNNGWIFSRAPRCPSSRTTAALPARSPRTSATLPSGVAPGMAPRGADRAAAGRDEHGAVAVMVSPASQCILFVAAALVVDLGLARDTKRQSQNAADAAALAAGNVL